MDVVSPTLPRQQRLNLHVIPAGISLAYSVLLIALLLLRLIRVTHPFILTLLVSMTPFLFIFLPIALALAILGRSRAGVIVSIALSVFAAIWLGGIFLPQAAAQSSGLPISFLVFNSNGKDLTRLTAEPWLNTQPADIVLMQETYYVQLDPGIENLRDTYPYQAIQITELGYRGNSTLSIYPIEEEGREGFKPDSAFTRVVIDFHGNQIAVYNVSLHAPFGADAVATPLSMLTHYDTQFRDEQLEQLLERLSRETLPAVVGGEFNLTEFDPAYDRLAAVLTDSFREAGTGMGFTFPAGGGYSLNGLLQPIMRLDYLWYSEAFSALTAQVGESVDSDRLPLTVHLDFESP